jgi:CHAT domain-containing protein/Tfp pilus assembly protein PilF
MLRARLLPCLLVLAIAGSGEADEPRGRAPVRDPKIVAAAERFLTAWRAADDGAMRAVAADVRDPWPLALCLVAPLVRGEPDGAAGLDAADRLALVAASRPDLGRLAEWLSALRAADAERLASERRRLAFADRLNAAIDERAYDAMITAVDGEAAAAISTPFECLVRDRLGFALWSTKRMPRAIGAYAEKARAGEALGWPRATLDGWSTSGRAAYLSGTWSAVTEAADRAVPLADLLGARHLAASMLRLAAGAWRRLGRPKDALATLVDVEARWRALGESSEAATAMVVRADVLLDLGLNDEAEAVLAASLREMESLPARRDVVRRAHLEVEGRAFELKGRYAEAVDRYESAVRENESAKDADGLAAALTNLAGLLRRLGDAQRAVELHRRALALRERTEDRAEIGRTLLNLGGALGSLGRMDEAREHLERALAIHREGGDRTLLGETLLNLSGVRRELGDRAGAVAAAREALALLGDDPLRTRAVFAGVQLGRALDADGRPAEALAAWEQAVEAARRSGDATHYGASAHFDLAVARLDRGELDEALRLAREALLLHRRALQGLGEPEGGTLRRDVRFAAEVALEAALRSPDPSARLAEALWFCESARAMLLASVIGRADALRTVELSAALREEDATSRARLVAAREGLRRALAGGDAAAFELARLALEAAHATREETVARVARSAHRLAGVAWPEPVTLDEVRRGLPEHGAFVLYQFTRRRLLAIVVRPAGAWLVDLGEADPVRKETDAWLRLVAADGGSEATLAARLYDRLVRPLESRLVGVRSLEVAPDETLAFVPFDALLRSEKDASQRLLERWEVVAVPSATVAALVAADAKGAPPGRGVLVLADPRQGPSSPSLRASREEAAAVASSVPEGDLTLLLGKDATVAALERALDARPGRWRAVHLACHARVDPEHPRLSALLLADGEPFDVDRLQGRRLPADLVVLSACETARGRVLVGEGPLGFVRALLAAGAARVVASTWKVDDESTRDLMTAFHEAWLRGGTSAAAALRAAKLARLKAGGPEAHPARWAAFVLWGLR